MSLNKFYDDQTGLDLKLQIGCDILKCNECVCDNMIIPSGGDLTAHDVKVENKLESQTQDLAGYNNYQTPNLGAPNYSLHTDGAGNTYWDPDATGSGIQYTGTTPIPLGTHLKINTTDGNTAVESKIEESATEIKLNGIKLNADGNSIENCPTLNSGGPMDIFCGAGGDLSLTSGTFGGDLKFSAPGGLISVLSNTSMNGNSISDLQNIDAGGGTLSISNTGFPALDISGGINCNNSAFLYQCPSVYAGTGNLVLGSDTLGTEIQTGPFGSRQTEMTILPNLINVNSAFTNFLGNDIVMAQGRIQDLKRVDGGGAGGNYIEMVDPGFLNAINISSNGNGVILQEATSTNNIGILSSGGGMAVANGALTIRNADAANDLLIVKQFGGDIVLDSAGLVIVNNSNLDMNNNGIDNVATINSLTAVGGVFAGTSDGTVINNTTEQSVLPATGVGSLTIPANGFAVGDCFHCVVAGDCSFDKDDTIQIKLKENGNILAQTPVFNLEDAQAGDNAFEIEVDFTIRSLGATGSIATNFDFTYNKDGTESKDFRGTRAMDVQPIDTTVASTLDITVQFPTNVTPSSLQTKLFRLQKVY